MKRKKGFTLIELLAVIVILGVLAVIIVPKVQKSLRDSKKNTYESSANALDREADVFYANQKINQSNFNGCEYNFTTGNNTCEGFEFKGEKPESGGLKISKDGKSAFGLRFDDYCYSKGYNDDEINIIETDNCVIPKQIGEEVVISGEHFYVIDSNAEETKLLAKYNINVGYNKNPNLPENRQDQSLVGGADPSYAAYDISPTWITYDWSEECPSINTNFLNTNYGTSYPIYFYNENSSFFYEHLQAYKSILTNVKEVRLPSYEEIVKLGCTRENCNNAEPWLYSTNYWTGTAANDIAAYAVETGGYLGSSPKIAERITSYDCMEYFGRDNTYKYGVRPVVIVNTKDI